MINVFVSGGPFPTNVCVLKWQFCVNREDCVNCEVFRWWGNFCLILHAMECSSVNRTWVFVLGVIENETPLRRLWGVCEGEVIPVPQPGGSRRGLGKFHWNGKHSSRIFRVVGRVRPMNNVKQYKWELLVNGATSGTTSSIFRDQWITQVFGRVMACKTPVRLGVTLNLMCSAPKTTLKEFVIKTKGGSDRHRVGQKEL